MTHYSRWRVYGDPLTPIPKSHALGRNAEIRVAQYLRECGRSVQGMPLRHPFDLLVDGWRVDVKCADMVMRRGHPTWVFGVLQQGYRDKPEDTDFYILRAVNVPHAERPVHLLFKAPLAVNTMQLSVASMLCIHGQGLADFVSFASGKYGKKEIAA